MNMSVRQEVSKVEVPTNTFIDMEWVRKNVSVDVLVSGYFLAELKDRVEEDFKRPVILVDHKYDNSFIVLDVTDTINIANGVLKIFAANSKSAGILIGKNGANLKVIKNKVNVSMCGFTGLTNAKGYPADHIRNFKIVNLSKQI